ncbi:glutathione S-transferase family protein [Phreatobacter stygius]|nr:glutathione S-transferase family protein [Phreatobacter stygius]
MSKRFTLHGFWLSGPTYKVALMLSLCGEPFAFRQINLRAGEHKTPDFLAKNRFGQVPALDDAKLGVSLCQSAAILEHLALELGRFKGDEPGDLIRAREWMFWDFDKLAPPIYRSRACRAGLRSFNQPIMEMYAAEANLALKTLNDHLAGRDWLVGKSPTIADIDIYGVACMAGQAGFDITAHANVAAWAKRFEGLPGFGNAQAVVPQEHRA